MEKVTRIAKTIYWVVAAVGTVISFVWLIKYERPAIKQAQDFFKDEDFEDSEEE